MKMLSKSIFKNMNNTVMYSSMISLDKRLELKHGSIKRAQSQSSQLNCKIISLIKMCAAFCLLYSMNKIKELRRMKVFIMIKQ